MTLTQITEKGIKDGEIVNADINASAAIAKSKLASLDIVNGDINASAAIAKSKLASLDIVNADVNASAAIAGSKISPSFGNQAILTTNSITVDGSVGDTIIASSGAEIQFTRAASSNITCSDSSGSLNINTGGIGNTRMTIDSTGKVGINATSPSHILDVRGASNTTFDHVSTIQLLGDSAYDSDDAGAGINFGGKYNASGDLTTFAQISGIKADTGNGSYDGAITFGVRNDTSGMGLDIERLRIDADGNLKLRNTTTNHQGIQFYHNNNLGCSFSYGEGNANPTLNIYRADAQSGFPYGSLKINTGDGTNPSLALKLRTDKNIELSGNLIMAENKGIQFYNYGTGSNISSNLLDDYEEGTFTPLLSDNLSSGTANSYQNQSGHYTKIGNIVHIIGGIRANDISNLTSSNTLCLRGLPFAASNVTTGSGEPDMLHIPFMNNLTNVDRGLVYGRIENGVAGAQLGYPTTTVQSGGNLSVSQINSGGNATFFSFSATYRTGG